MCMGGGCGVRGEAMIERRCIGDRLVEVVSYADGKDEQEDNFHYTALDVV